MIVIPSCMATLFFGLNFFYLLCHRIGFGLGHWTRKCFTTTAANYGIDTHQRRDIIISNPIATGHGCRVVSEMVMRLRHNWNWNGLFINWFHFNGTKFHFNRRLLSRSTIVPIVIVVMIYMPKERWVLWVLLLVLNGLVILVRLGLTIMVVVVVAPTAMVSGGVRASSRWDVETHVPTLESLALGPINFLKHFRFYSTPS